MAREHARKGEGEDRLPGGWIIRRWTDHIRKLRDGIRNRRKEEDVPLRIVLTAEDVSKFLTVSGGDGFVAAGLRIRLLDIDAPEIGQNCSDGDGGTWPCGRKARWRLYELLAGREIEVQIHDVDRYGRLLATCHVGGRDVGETMVREGLAECHRSDRYGDAEDEAVRHGRGIWRDAQRTPASRRRCRDDGTAGHAEKHARKEKRRIHPLRRDLLLTAAGPAQERPEPEDASRRTAKRSHLFGARKNTTTGK